MAEPRAGWEQVGERLSELGLKLKLHFEQANEAGRPEDEDKIKDALHAVGDAVNHAFTAVSNAAKDQAVREDVKDAGRTVVEALDATFSQLGDRFRSSVKRDAPPSEPPETPPGS